MLILLYNKASLLAETITRIFLWKAYQYPESTTSLYIIINNGIFLTKSPNLELTDNLIIILILACLILIDSFLSLNSLFNFIDILKNAYAKCDKESVRLILNQIEKLNMRNKLNMNKVAKNNNSLLTNMIKY